MFETKLNSVFIKKRSGAELKSLEQAHQACRMLERPGLTGSQW